MSQSQDYELIYQAYRGACMRREELQRLLEQALGWLQDPSGFWGTPAGRQFVKDAENALGWDDEREATASVGTDNKTSGSREPSRAAAAAQDTTTTPAGGPEEAGTPTTHQVAGSSPAPGPLGRGEGMVSADAASVLSRYDGPPMGTLSNADEEPERDACVRCWRCKHDVPESTTVCNAGIGTQCKDAKACRGRWYGPQPRPSEAWEQGTHPDTVARRRTNEAQPVVGPGQWPFAWDRTPANVAIYNEGYTNGERETAARQRTETALPPALLEALREWDACFVWDEPFEGYPEEMALHRALARLTGGTGT